MSKKLKCVYALEMSNSTVKIGMSQNVKKRIAAITNASGLNVLNCYNTKTLAEEIARTIEKACHETFSAYRIKGEFFNIAFSDACETLKNLVTEYELKTNGVQVFNHEKFGRIRTVIIDGEIWFVAIDVCRALGFTNSRKALSDHVDAEDKKPDVTIRDVSSNGVIQNRKVTLINESGVYALIFGSKLPKAKEFKHHVTSNILPQIRKYGYYKVDDSQYQLAPDEVEKDGLLFFRPTKKFKDRDSYYEAYAKKTAEWEEKYPDGDYEVAAITPEYNKEGKLMLNYHVGFNPNPKKTNEY